MGLGISWVVFVVVVYYVFRWIFVLVLDCGFYYCVCFVVVYLVIAWLDC